MAIKNYPHFWEGKGKGIPQLQKIRIKILAAILKQQKGAGRFMECAGKLFQKPIVLLTATWAFEKVGVCKSNRMDLISAAFVRVRE